MNNQCLLFEISATEYKMVVSITLTFFKTHFFGILIKENNNLYCCSALHFPQKRNQDNLLTQLVKKTRLLVFCLLHEYCLKHVFFVAA